MNIPTRSPAVQALVIRNLQRTLTALIERAVLYPGPLAEQRVAAVKAELAAEGGAPAPAIRKASAPKLTPAQRRRVRELVKDEGESRASAVAWVLGMEHAS
jgi:hypothetical protein